MPYKTDEHGEYRVLARWIDAWNSNGGNYVPGWRVCEAREYETGDVRIHRGEDKYLHECSVEMGVMHAVFMAISRALGA